MRRFHTPLVDVASRRQYYFNRDLVPLLDLQRPMVEQLRSLARRRPQMKPWLEQILERIMRDLEVMGDATYAELMRIARRLNVPPHSIWRHTSNESDFIQPIASWPRNAIAVSERGEPYNNACDPRWIPEEHNGSFITARKERQPLEQRGLIQPFPLVAPSKREWLCCGLPYLGPKQSHANGCWIDYSGGAGAGPVPYRIFNGIPRDPSLPQLKEWLRATMDDESSYRGTAWLDRQYFDGLHAQIKADRAAVAMTLWRIANWQPVSTVELNRAAMIYGLIDRYNDPQRPQGPEAPQFLGGDPASWLRFLAYKAFQVIRPDGDVVMFTTTVESDLVTEPLRNPQRDAEPFLPIDVPDQFVLDGRRWTTEDRLSPEADTAEKRRARARLQPEPTAPQLELARRRQEEEQERLRRRRRQRDAEQALEQRRLERQQEEREREREQREAQEALEQQRRRQEEGEREREQREAQETLEQQRLEGERQRQEEEAAQPQVEEGDKELEAERRVLTSVVLDDKDDTGEDVEEETIEDQILRLVTDKDLQQFFAFAKQDSAAARVRDAYKDDFVRLVKNDDALALQDRTVQLKRDIRPFEVRYTPDLVPLSVVAMRFELKPSEARSARALRKAQLTMRDFVAYAKRIEADSTTVETVNDLLDEFWQLDWLKKFLRANQNVEQRQATAKNIEEQSARVIERGAEATRALRDEIPSIDPVDEYEFKWLWSSRQNRIPVDERERLAWVIETHWKLRRWYTRYSTTTQTMQDIIGTVADGYELLTTLEAEPDLALIQDNLNDAIAKGVAAGFDRDVPLETQPIDIDEWVAVLVDEQN